jgi:hypothetical protein
VQIWVPDTRSPAFQREARLQSERINQADRHDGLMDWVEEISIFDENATG